VDDAHELDAVFLLAIEDEISAEDPRPCVRRDLRAYPTQARIVRQQSALRLDPVKQAIGRARLSCAT
jgi:hypothetical protein